MTGSSDGAPPAARPVDERALAELFARDRDRLWRLVRARLDRRLLGRVAPEDVLQEAYLNASRRLGSVEEGLLSSPRLWLRLVVGQTLVDVHRRHLGARRRDAGREVSLHRHGPPGASTSGPAAGLAGAFTPPSQAARRHERALGLEAALGELGPVDREVLVLRHLEELSNGEVAEVLGLTPAAASIRYVRALARFKAVLAQRPEFADEPG